MILYDHGQVIEDPSLLGRVGFTGTIIYMRNQRDPLLLKTTFVSFDLPDVHFNSTLKADKSTLFPTIGLPLSADIMLNDTQVSDAGIYRCMVNNPPEPADPSIGELVLSVLGKCVT